MKLLEDIAVALATVFNTREKVSTQTWIPTSGSGLTLDLKTASSFKIYLDANCAIEFSNPSSGQVTTIILMQDGSGNRVPTFNSEVIRWQGDVVPTWSTNPLKKDIVTIYYDDHDELFYASAITDYA